jgi:hypothetical protein
LPQGDVRTVLTIGSMTSLHKFQVTYPESFAKIETLYAMFGAVDVDGNVFHSNPIWKAEYAFALPTLLASSPTARGHLARLLCPAPLPPLFFYSAQVLE